MIRIEKIINNLEVINMSFIKSYVQSRQTRNEDFMGGNKLTLAEISQREYIEVNEVKPIITKDGAELIALNLGNGEWTFGNSFLNTTFTEMVGEYTLTKVNEELKNSPLKISLKLIERENKNPFYAVSILD